MPIKSLSYSIMSKTSCLQMWLCELPRMELQENGPWLLLVGMKFEHEYRSKSSNDTWRRILCRSTYWLCIKEGNKNNLYSRRIIFSWLSVLAIPTNIQNKLE